MRAFIVLLLALASTGSAQVLDLRPGAKVRLTAPGVVAGEVEGTVVNRSGDSISVVGGQGTVYELSLGSVNSLYLSHGKSRTKGAARGAIWGGGIMLALAAALSGDSELRKANEYSEPMSVPTFLAIEAVGGAMIGATIGAIVGSEQWSSLELQRVRVGVGPSRVGVSFSF